MGVESNERQLSPAVVTQLQRGQRFLTSTTCLSRCEGRQALVVVCVRHAAPTPRHTSLSLSIVLAYVDMKSVKRKTMRHGASHTRTRTHHLTIPRETARRKAREEREKRDWMVGIGVKLYMCDGECRWWPFGEEKMGTPSEQTQTNKKWHKKRRAGGSVWPRRENVRTERPRHRTTPTDDWKGKRRRCRRRRPHTCAAKSRHTHACGGNASTRV